MSTAIMIISILCSVSGLVLITFDGRRPTDMTEQIIKEIQRYYKDRWGLGLMAIGAILYIIGLII